MRQRILIAAVVAASTAVATLTSAQAATSEFGYITDRMMLPVTPAEASTYARDIDRDGHKDNALGQVFATMGTQNIDLQAIMDEALTSGEIVMLHSLRTPSLANTRNATWQVWYGAPTANPDFSGSGVFQLRSNQPHSVRIAATIKNHVVRTVLGTIPVRLDIGGGPFLLTMKKAKVVATCYRAGCDPGTITGAIPATQIDAKIPPEIAQWVTAVLAAGGCVLEGTGADTVVTCEDSSAASLESIFNTADPATGEDLVITADEVRENNLIEAVLAPDLNLVSGDGGAKDHMSFGFGFETVRARLTRP